MPLTIHPSRVPMADLSMHQVVASIEARSRLRAEDCEVVPCSPAPQRGKRTLAALLAAVAIVGGVAWRASAASGADAACLPIHYVINPSHAPTGGLTDVHAATTQLTAVSGLRFVYDGLTNESPSEARPTRPPAGSANASQPVLVAWSTPDNVAAFRASTKVVGFAWSSWTDDSSHYRRFNSGWVYLNASRTKPSGFVDRHAWGGTVLHELGHLAGLSHSTNPADLMYPEMTNAPARYSPGEVRALSHIGALAGCPAPRLTSVVPTADSDL
jgi:hypothetical protein